MYRAVPARRRACGDAFREEMSVYPMDMDVVIGDCTSYLSEF